MLEPGTTVQAAPEVSVVIPVFNEHDNVAPLVAEVRAVLEGIGVRHEVILVDDGSTDGTAEACIAIGWARLVRHDANRGQSAAIVSGIQAAAGQIIVTLDGDGQNDPAAIPALLAALQSSDVAQGIRTKRHDTLWRRLGSRVAWLVRNMVVRDGIRDIGCSLRAFRREHALRLPQFDGLHRLMPAIFVFMGLKVTQVPTLHRARTSGTSKYGNLKRGARGLLDLAGLYWLKRRVFRAQTSR